MPSAVNQGPGNCQCGCTTTFTGLVRGCSTLALAGLTVEAHDSTAGGTLLGSTTTDAGGNFSLTVGATAGNAVVLVFTHPRFTTQTRTLAWHASTHDATHWTCGQASSVGTVDMVADSANYVCITGCAVPLPKTLHVTHSFFGAFTLTWALASQWKATLNYAYPGCKGCAADTIAVGINYDGAGGAGGAYRESWKQFQPLFPPLLDGCPVGAGAATFIQGPGDLSAAFTCPPSFSAAFSFTIDATTDNTGARYLYCVNAGAPLTVTIAIVE